MTITLSQETQRLLEEQLKRGHYGSTDELLQAALLALDEPGDLDQATLEAIDKAEEEIERGEFVDWDDVRDDIRAEFRGGRGE